MVENVARFQSVGTNPAYRRRGACGTLVHATSTWARAKMGARTLVLVADPDEHARGIYESVGYKVTEQQTAMYWFEREAWTRPE